MRKPLERQCVEIDANAKPLPQSSQHHFVLLHKEPNVQVSDSRRIGTGQRRCHKKIVVVKYYLYSVGISKEAFAQCEGFLISFYFGSLILMKSAERLCTIQHS